jgi:hypothetical protein
MLMMQDKAVILYYCCIILIAFTSLIENLFMDVDDNVACVGNAFLMWDAREKNRKWRCKCSSTYRRARQPQKTKLLTTAFFDFGPLLFLC